MYYSIVYQSGNVVATNNDQNLERNYLKLLEIFSSLPIHMVVNENSLQRLFTSKTRWKTHPATSHISDVQPDGNVSIWTSNQITCYQRALLGMRIPDWKTKPFNYSQPPLNKQSATHLNRLQTLMWISNHPE